MAGENKDSTTQDEIDSDAVIAAKKAEAEAKADVVAKADAAAKAQAIADAAAQAELDAEDAAKAEADAKAQAELDAKEAVKKPEAEAKAKMDAKPKEANEFAVTVKNTTDFTKLEPSSRTRIEGNAQVVIECDSAEKQATVLKNIQQINSLSGREVLQVIE